MNKAVFQKPLHDHSHCASQTLLQAESVCAKNKAKLTPVRRRVLEAVAASHAPIGAYDIIETLTREDNETHAPMTIYRALDFLREQGLIHRLASKNAYLACNHCHQSGEMAIFLICDSCGTAGELSDSALAAKLKSAAEQTGFHANQHILEMTGQCSHCQQN